MSNARAALRIDDSNAKGVCFYKAFDDTFEGVRVPITTRRHPTIDAVFDELTPKVPGLNYGVRKIFTSHGRDSVTSVHDLKHDEKYLCTDKTYLDSVRPLDLRRIEYQRGRKKFKTAAKDVNWKELGLGHESSKSLDGLSSTMSLSDRSPMENFLTSLRKSEPRNAPVLVRSKSTRLNDFLAAASKSTKDAKQPTTKPPKGTKSTKETGKQPNGTKEEKPKKKQTRATKKKQINDELRRSISTPALATSAVREASKKPIGLGRKSSNPELQLGSKGKPDQLITAKPSPVTLKNRPGTAVLEPKAEHYAPAKLKPVENGEYAPIPKTPVTKATMPLVKAESSPFARKTSSPKQKESAPKSTSPSPDRSRELSPVGKKESVNSLQDKIIDLEEDDASEEEKSVDGAKLQGAKKSSRAGSPSTSGEKPKSAKGVLPEIHAKATAMGLHATNDLSTLFSTKTD